MQPVGTAFYSDMELLQLVERMNKLKPYAFYIVDTLGSMYRNDVTHRFHLINENMDPAIQLGFHGHNNLQLAFSNAQILGKIQTKRTLILDSSVYGMGRGAGNLPTELITQYINKNIASKYDVSMVMDIYDEHIAAIRKEYEWGYTLPYHIAASHVCHPNYAAYLINKQTLTMNDIEKIIQSIPEDYKVLYDRKLVERLYVQYQSKSIDDSANVSELTEWIHGRDVLLLAPGKSLVSEYDTVLGFIKQSHPFIISVNFIDAQFHIDACFVSNHKRMDGITRELQTMPRVRTILTSNITGGEADSLYVDYNRYTNEDEAIADNAGLMLLKLLHVCGVRQVHLAGFDGFHHKHNITARTCILISMRTTFRKNSVVYAYSYVVCLRICISPFSPGLSMNWKKAMYKCIVFDMDGTLIDSFEGIDKAYRQAFTQLNRKYPGESFVRRAIGAPLPQVFKDGCGMSKEETAEAVRIYRAYYDRFGKYEAVVYKGIKDVLQALKAAGIFLGVATLKKEAFARDILRHCSLFSYFDVVHGMDGKDTLAKADLIRRCMEDARVCKTQTVLVGDSSYDAAGAKAAGVDFLAVTYGFGFSAGDPSAVLEAKWMADIPWDILSQVGLQNRMINT